MTNKPPRHAAGQERTPRAPLAPIKFDALARELLGRAESLCEQWLPGGKKQGKEYVCGSVRGGEGSSCSINLTTGKWADFAGGEKGGDLISLYAAGNDMDNGAAAIAIARDYGLEDIAGIQPLREGAAAPRTAPKPLPPPKVEKPTSDEGWATVVPVPVGAVKPGFSHYKRNTPEHQDVIGHMAEYRVDDALYGYVVRFVTSDGGKETLPYTWCTSARDGASNWRWRHWDEPRPLYFPSHTLPNGKVVVLVEGEKKADILQAALDAVAPAVYHVTSWPGGSNAWKKASWHWLSESHVLLWPDCDGKREKLTVAERKACVDAAAVDVAQAMRPLLPPEKQPGMKAMLGIGAQLRDMHGCRVDMLKIPEPLEVVDGWDCADAIDTDGWTGERLLAFFGTAHTLVANHGDSADLAASSGDGGGKKIDGLVDTGDGGSADDDQSGMTKVGGYSVPDWLVPYYDKGNKRWMVSRKMVILILERDIALQDILAYNELSNNIQSREKWPWAYAEAGDVTDAVDLLLGKYLTDKYGLPSIPRAALSEAIETVAHARRFHPVREYLQSLPAHDLDKDKSRIDNWLPHVLGESPETLRPAMLEYLQIVGRCWLLGMVNRVMQPGCKFDYCPVLEGVGGLRKSTLVEVLASTPYFSDTPFEVGKGKEAQEQVQGLWLYEIAEMTHFSKAEVGAIKAFITSKIDRYRVAYGKTVGTFPRQCVLVGTTNENTYLRDRTGNRRFWPIPVRNVINTEWMGKYRDALFAEAYALYQRSERFVPTPDQEARLFVPMQESRLVETAVLSELLNVLTRPPHQTGIGSIVNGNANFVTISQLTLALGVDAAKSSPALEAQIRGWLDFEGWMRRRPQINGVRAWGYVRPAGWPKDDEQDDMTATPPTVAKPDAGIDVNVKEDGDDVPF